VLLFRKLNQPTQSNSLIVLKLKNNNLKYKTMIAQFIATSLVIVALYYLLNIKEDHPDDLL
jgi:hypothetical protein